MSALRVMVVHNRYRSEQPSGEDRVVDQEGLLLEEAGHEVDRFLRHSDDIARDVAARQARGAAAGAVEPRRPHRPRRQAALPSP